MQQLLHIIYLACLLGSAIAAFLYRNQLKSRQLFPFIPFLFLLFIQEATMFIVLERNPGHSTGFVYNLYTPANTLFFALFYSSLPANASVRKLIHILSILFLTATLFTYFCIQSVYIYNSYLSLAGGFLITLSGILFLFNYFKLDNPKEEKKWLPVLWITIGVVTFYPVVNISFALYKYLLAYQAASLWNEIIPPDTTVNEYFHVRLFYQGILFMQKEKLELIISVIAASLFVLLLAISVLFLFRIYLKRKNKLLLEKERMNIEFEQTLLKSKLEIQEQTFNDISREIHDNIGQVLSLVRINLNTLKAPDDTDKVNLMDELMGKAITDLRTLSHSLDADHIRNKGWMVAVTKLLNDLQKTGKYNIHVKQDEDLPTLGNDKPIILFRMIQEVINNIIRHAAANTIHLDAKKENSKLVIKLSDNGKGFDTDKNSGGVGLQNLKNRSKMINADLSVTSEPGKGTAVTISIKTDNNE